MRTPMALLMVLTCAAPVMAQVSDEATVHVVGTGSVERFPDRAIIRLRVVGASATSSDALVRHAVIVRDVVDRVRNLAGASAEVDASAPHLWSTYIYGWQEEPTQDTVFAGHASINGTFGGTAAAVSALDQLAAAGIPTFQITGGRSEFSLHFNLVERDASAGRALELVTRRIDELRERLVDAGATRFHEHFDVRMENAQTRAYRSRERRQEYRASGSATITLDSLALLSELIDAVQETGAELGGVSYGLRDHDAALREAYQRAVQNARDHASALAAAAGAHLDELVRIDIPEPRYDSYLSVSAIRVESEGAESALERPPTPIAVTARVTVDYRLRR